MRRSLVRWSFPNATPHLSFRIRRFGISKMMDELPAEIRDAHGCLVNELGHSLSGHAGLPHRHATPSVDADGGGTPLRIGDLFRLLFE